MSCYYTKLNFIILFHLGIMVQQDCKNQFGIPCTSVFYGQTFSYYFYHRCCKDFQETVNFLKIRCSSGYFALQNYNILTNAK